MPAPYLFFNLSNVVNFLTISVTLLLLTLWPPGTKWVASTLAHVLYLTLYSPSEPEWACLGEILLNSDKVSLNVYLVSLLIFFISETKNSPEGILICLVSLVTPLELSKIPSHISFMSLNSLTDKEKEPIPTS